MPTFIYEGTAQELAPRLSQLAKGRFRLIEILESAYPVDDPEQEEPIIDDENAAAIALINSWRMQEFTEDPEELRLAEEELAEFKRNMNANRVATGDEPVYP